MQSKMRLLTPGPTPLPEQVRLAMAKDMLHHRKTDFAIIMQEIQGSLQVLFGTSEPVLILSASGTGAMTAAVHNLFSKGEEVLVVEAGKFGERWREISEVRGLKVHSLQIPWGEAAKPEKIQEILDSNSQIKGLLIQHSETSTGVLHPIEEIAKITANRDVLLVVDGISAVGICPCPMDSWKIDCLLTGSQKGLLLPPGLSLIALSARAKEKAKNTNSDCYYFNLHQEHEHILRNQTLFTSPVGLLLGLSESLKLLVDDGLDMIFHKQWALTMLVRAGIKAMGLEFLAKDHYTWGLTSIKVPEGVNGKEIVKFAAKEHNVIFAGGQDHLSGKIVRFGHMGHIDWADALAGLYALNHALKQAGGYSSSRDYLEQAMLAWQASLHNHIGIEPEFVH